MSERDEKSASVPTYVSLPPELDAIAQRLADARYSTKAQVIRQAFGEWCRDNGEIAEPVAEVA